MQYVYSLKCKDGYYVGCTDNLKERIERHTKGYVPATKERRPIKLVNYIAFKDKYLAFEFEKYLKSGSGRAFIGERCLNTPSVHRGVEDTRCALYGRWPYLFQKNSHGIL